MDALASDFDCESILEMVKETPDSAAVIIDMISDLGEADENCLRKVRELQASVALTA